MNKYDKGKILEKHFPTPGNHPDSEAIYEAMDEYAKQQAIAFAKYVIVDVYKMNSISGSPFVSDDDVYGHFIEQQNK